MTVDPGSFRDPSGYVHHIEDRVYRTVTPQGRAAYSAVRKNGALNALQDRGWVIGADEVNGIKVPGASSDDIILEHPRVPVISYPFEWPFRALKDAALLHLSVQIELLEHNITLSDATAFNIQFRGTTPVFIDYLSFRPYRDREPWSAHRQFCESFLNPLVLQALIGVPHQSWYRGSFEGISTVDLAKLMKPRHWLSPVLLSHVLLPAKWERRTDEALLDAAQSATRRGLTRSRFHAILEQLYHFISRLEPKGISHTTWRRYAEENTYQPDEVKTKKAIVSRFAKSTRPALLVDLGCNDGTFSREALENGAKRAVGLDADQGALDTAYRWAAVQGIDFLPLYQDLADPTSGQGWKQQERASIFRRLDGAEAVLALALVHHLTIARNVPLDAVIEMIAAIAPIGLIEFVPKSDQTVRTMLALRDNVFQDYTRDAFVTALEARAEIVVAEIVSKSGREVFHYRRR